MCVFLFRAPGCAAHEAVMQAFLEKAELLLSASLCVFVHVHVHACSFYASMCLLVFWCHTRCVYLFSIYPCPPLSLCRTQRHCLSTLASHCTPCLIGSIRPGLWNTPPAWQSATCYSSTALLLLPAQPGEHVGVNSCDKSNMKATPPLRLQLPSPVKFSVVIR